MQAVLAYLWGESSHSFATQPAKAGESVRTVGTDPFIVGTTPSSEFPFHQAIYAARSDIQAIVHAHPVALVAYSICRQMPDTRLFHQAHSVCGSIGFMSRHI